MHLIFASLTEHPFTDSSALYRIPLELVQNRNQIMKLYFLEVALTFSRFIKFQNTSSSCGQFFH
eukprot:UN21088